MVLRINSTTLHPEMFKDLKGYAMPLSHIGDHVVMAWNLVQPLDYVSSSNNICLPKAPFCIVLDWNIS